MFLNAIFGRYEESISLVLVHFETIGSKPLSLISEARRLVVITPLLVGMGVSKFYISAVVLVSYLFKSRFIYQCTFITYIVIFTSPFDAFSPVSSSSA